MIRLLKSVFNPQARHYRRQGRAAQSQLDTLRAKHAPGIAATHKRRVWERANQMRAEIGLPVKEWGQS